MLACASKKLSYEDNYYEYKNDRLKYEKDLTFLGFIIFMNKLKKDTKLVINNLNNINCQLVMSTGDNPFTSISVAKQCELIKSDSNIYLIDTENDTESNTCGLRL